MVQISVVTVEMHIRPSFCICSSYASSSKCNMANRVYISIFRFLTPRELLEKAALISKPLKASADSDELWAELVDQTFGPAERVSAAVSWRQEFQWRLRARSVVKVKAGAVELTQVPLLRTQLFEITGLVADGEVCWLWTGQLAQVGGQVNAVPQTTAIFISVNCGKYVSGPSMTRGRCYHALVACYPFIYAFGGFNCHILTSCEKLNLHANCWSALPDMSQPRRSFTPAVLRAHIYLVGGANMQIERFSTERDNFEVLKLALDKPYTSVLGLVYHDRLIFLNFKRVTEILLTPGGLKVERTKEVALKDWRGSGA